MVYWSDPRFSVIFFPSSTREYDKVILVMGGGMGGREWFTVVVFHT